MDYANQTSVMTLLVNETVTAGKDLTIPLYMYISVSISYCLIFLIGLIGNFLVIFVVLTNPTMRSSTNVFLVNLSVADICVLLVCVPTALTEFYAKDVWYLGEFMCRMVPYLENTTALASVLTILAISLERYYAICFPLKAQYKCTMSVTIKVICCIWLVSALLNSPFISLTFLEDTMTYDLRPVQVCRTHISLPWQQGYILGMMVLGMGAPLVILLFLYGCIIWCLISKQDNFSDVNSVRLSKHDRQRKQVIVMLVSIIILFFISLLPFRVVSIWLVYAPMEHITSLGLHGYLNLLNFARVMFYINSAGNPILYNFCSSKFRLAFKRALLVRRQRSPFKIDGMSSLTRLPGSSSMRSKSSDV